MTMVTTIYAFEFLRIDSDNAAKSRRDFNGQPRWRLQISIER